MFGQLTTFIQVIVDSSTEGINFLFGGLFAGEGIGHIFAFQVLPVIVFLSSLISVLYYVGFMQILIKIIGSGLAKLLKTSKSESASAAANIFVGLTEAPLVIKPYLAKMTRSELFAVMTGGAASVSGSVLVGYSLLGIPLEYLLAAAFMAAPAGLLMAKIIMPEDDFENQAGQEITFERDPDTVNVIDAAAKGAGDGLNMALSIGALLLAFISLITLANIFIGGFGSLIGLESLTLQTILGYLLAPLAFVIGVPWDEAIHAGSYIGQKFILNEFVAYTAFAENMDNLSDKTVLIVSFALCGFANLAAIAMFIGGIGKLAPSRKPHLEKYGLLAVIAGTLANLLSAAVAGMFI